MTLVLASSLALVPPEAGAATNVLSPADRAALINLFETTNGPNWTNKSGWLGPPGTECNWHGVLCYASTVFALELYYNNLEGPMPDLTPFSNAQEFAFFGNKLSGPLPSLAGMTGLRTFHAAQNQFTGSIPPLVDVPVLGVYNVDSNQLTGTLPDLSFAPMLASFSASNNLLTGTIPSLAGMSTFMWLDVHGNQLTGSIPAITGMPWMEYLDVSFNQLSGSLPSLAGVPRLRRLLANNNQLTGSIPALDQVPVLELLYVYGNALTGTIPSLAHVPEMRWFVVSFNQLTGPVPSLAGVRRLIDFSVSQNALTGVLPALDGLTELVVLDASGCGLSGVIPDLSQLYGVRGIYLTGNALTGVIPSLAGLGNLEELVLGGNQLTGPIPSLQGLNSLRWLGLWSNQLSGPIPALGAAGSLQFVDLSHNQLAGPIASFQALPLLRGISLSHNQLTGALPDVSGAALLYFVDVSSNKLAGPIPAFVDLPALEYFRADNNALTGSIPDLRGLPSITRLIVDNNKLTGDLPPAPATMQRPGSRVCPNYLNRVPSADWDAITGDSPWFDSYWPCPLQAQRIEFGPLIDRIAGSGPIQVAAASVTTLGELSGVPIVFGAEPSSVCISEGANGASIRLVGPGTCAVTASQDGNAGFAVALPVMRSFAVRKAATAIRITGTTPSPSQTEQAIGVSFAVTTIQGVALTSASLVTVRADGTTLCTATLAAGACSAPLQTAGTHVLTASYPGDVITGAAVSAPYGHSVDLPAASVMLLASPGTISRGLSSSVSARLTGVGTPTGTVTITGAGGSCSLTLAAGGGSCDFNPLATGLGQVLTGRYNGDGANAATSATTTIDVTSALDANDDGGSDALSDGMLIIRFLFKLHGSSLINGIAGSAGTRQGAAEIAGYLEAIRPLLDVDGNGAADALTDGLMIIRYLVGLRGSALTAGVIGTGATRDGPQIETYIQSLMP